jgi:catechol 2,3-dioxygenase
MAVLGIDSVTLEVPDLGAGVSFYTNAGLTVQVDSQRARFRCPGQSNDCIILLAGASAKRLRHITLRAEGLGEIAGGVARHGGRLVDPPQDSAGGGIWLTDTNGMLINLLDLPQDAPPSAGAAFTVNGPGRLVRKGRAAVLPVARCSPVTPLRLGHVLLFSPDVVKSVEFVTQALGMGLADQAQDVIAFCCTSRHSDHHVLAFAKSPAVGFHHASFQVNDPDEVGRGGRRLAQMAGKGDWGFGRHTIGSNFFHYIQDPWGSWFEYYSDMDYIEDYALWTPTNYALEDSLANWGPRVPADFVHNYEVIANAPS